MFKKNAIYYNTDNGYKLRYIDQCLERYYHFKILAHDDPENDWIEYSTKDGSEIVKTKKEADESRIQSDNGSSSTEDQGSGRIDSGIHERSCLP